MKVTEIITEAANPAQQAAIAISMKKAGKKPKNESTELEEEFDLIESIIERLAAHNGVDAEVIWEDLETLTEDELYAFAVTSEPIMESQGMAEGVPQPGPSSGAPKQFGSDAKIQTRQMTVKDIISSIPGVPYYNNVVDDWDAKDYGWGVTKKVIEYATYLKDHPESLAKLPPAIVLNGKFEDGAHRVSAIWLLQQRMDPKNPLWKNAKLNVQFVQQGVAEDWQKANKRDRTAGMSQKAVNAYRRENPGSKLKTAVTTKPSKLKRGSKASKRRKSYCSRSRGQMKMHSISCSKTPDKAICKARRHWNC